MNNLTFCREFLLEMLTNKEYRNIIRWQGEAGEFRLVQPEDVVALWGGQKNNQEMEYNKLSRALRNYC